MNTVSPDTATADGELSCAAVGEPPSPQGLVLVTHTVPLGEAVEHQPDAEDAQKKPRPVHQQAEGGGAPVWLRAPPAYYGRNTSRGSPMGFPGDVRRTRHHAVAHHHGCRGAAAPGVRRLILGD
jgi:hypothetical protein